MKLTLTTVPSECSNGTKKPFSPSGSAMDHGQACDLVPVGLGPADNLEGEAAVPASKHPDAEVAPDAKTAAAGAKEKAIVGAGATAAAVADLEGALSVLLALVPVAQHDVVR